MESATAPQAAHFGSMAADWWNPKGSSAMLHRLNPVRLRYIRERVDAHWHGDPKTRMPLSGKRVLDMGCGAGLLAEPLARMGGNVVGVDAARENIAVAKDHAAQSGLVIDYRAGEIDAVSGDAFDLITCLEVVEHVADPAAFIAGLAGLLTPGGLLILSTPNRTALSRLAIVGIGETVGGIPPGTHDWNSFLTPDELTALVAAAGLSVAETRGLTFGPLQGFHMSDAMKFDYFLVAHA
jgi:2-polyprenyl-6-hydroxyphenyl methylase / 3-demethylubiquinone-9 3-methyltransferase